MKILDVLLTMSTAEPNDPKSTLAGTQPDATYVTVGASASGPAGEAENPKASFGHLIK